MIQLVYIVTLFINIVPDALGVSERYSPREIVTQRKFDFERDCKVLFGSYVQASNDAIITNTMKLRTHGCVVLGTSGNWQGSTKCFDIETGKVVPRRVVKVVPYPDCVIKRVDDLGKTPRGEKYSDCLEFLNRNKQPFDWENEELNKKLPEVEEPIYPDILAEVPGLVLKSDSDDNNDVVMTPPPPTIEEQAEIALDNMGMAAEPSDDRQ